MSPRPYWKGYLKLSLVSCPIAVHAACSQRPRELPLSRVRSGRRPGDYRGSVERISASARVCRYRGSAAAGGRATIARPWSEFQRPRELSLSRVRSGRRPGDYRASWSEFQRPRELPLSSEFSASARAAAREFGLETGCIGLRPAQEGRGWWGIFRHFLAVSPPQETCAACLSSQSRTATPDARRPAPGRGADRAAARAGGNEAWGKFRSRPNIYSPFARPVSIFFRTNRAGFAGHPILGSSDGHIDPCAR